jgi:cysteinyl-tRNA synthetase
VFFVRDIQERGHDPLAFRMLVLGVSYRKGLDFTWASLAEGERRLNSWRSQLREAVQAGGEPSRPADDDPIRAAFAEAIADDFNTPRAVAQAEAALKLVTSTDDASRLRGLGLLFDMDRVLGLRLEASATAADELAGDDRRLFDERLAARKAGDYKRSDELRVALEARGIKVKDTKDGARWERIKEGSAR